MQVSWDPTGLIHINVTNKKYISLSKDILLSDQNTNKTRTTRQRKDIVKPSVFLIDLFLKVNACLDIVIRVAGVGVAQ